MSRSTRAGRRRLDAKSVGAFLLGVAIGLGLLAPVLPQAADTAAVGALKTRTTIVIVGTVTLGSLVVLVAVLFRSYLQR